MAENKNSFIFYTEWLETYENLTDDEAGKLIKHTLKYVNDQDPKAESKLTELLFIPMKQALKRDLKKFDKYKEKQRLNGAKGGRPKKTQITQALISKPKKADNVNVNVNVNDNVNVINKRKEDFKKSLHPFLEQYGKDLLNEFFSYWTEHGEKDRKMRFEKEKSFGISRRLSTWLKNQNNFKKEKNQPKKEKINAGELLKQKYGLS